MDEDAANMTQLTHLAAELSADLDIRGLAIGLTAGEGTAYYCRGALAGGTPVTTSTEMYAASLTKQVMGALTAMAIEEGAFAYDTPIATILPVLPSWAAGIRVHHLLHHTSGLPDPTTTAKDWPADNATLLEMLRATSAPAVAPGSRYAYSNTGYVILAEMLHRAWACHVSDVAAERLFRPLGMAHSRLGGPPRSLPGYTDAPGTVGDGGWWTTITDLHTWLLALQGHRLPCDVRRMEEPGHLNDGTAVDYGWGLGIREVAGWRAFVHGGGWPGWISTTRRLPERGIVVSILTHGDDEQSVITLGNRLVQSLLELH